MYEARHLDQTAYFDSARRFSVWRFHRLRDLWRGRRGGYPAGRLIEWADCQPGEFTGSYIGAGNPEPKEADPR